MTNLATQIQEAFCRDMKNLPEGEMITWPNDGVEMKATAEITKQFTVKVCAWGMNLGDGCFGEVLIGSDGLQISIPSEDAQMLIARPNIHFKIASETEFVLAKGDNIFALNLALPEKAGKIKEAMDLLGLEIEEPIAKEQDLNGNRHLSININDEKLKAA